MKHLETFTLFLERNDTQLAEILAENSVKYFEKIKNRIIDFYNKYVKDCREYNEDKSSDLIDIISSTSFNYMKIASPAIFPIQVFIKSSNKHISTAAAAYHDKKIEVYSSELSQILIGFEEHAVNALSLPVDDDDKAYEIGMSAYYVEKITEFNFKSLIEFLQHELVHHIDYSSKRKTGYGNREDVIQKDMERRSLKRKKGFEPDDLYFNANHEYQAYFMSYAASVQHDIRNGKPLPETFMEFKDMSVKDYQQLRLHRMDAKNRRLVLKRMYDLYDKLKTAAVSPNI